MESMCNKSDLFNENQVSEDAESDKIISRSESPVFKCFNPKSNRINRVDSSDYDIPSYQVNQSAKSKTSSKHESETSDLFLPFTPSFSPIPPAVQFQTPSVHTLGTVFKSMKQTSNTFSDKQVISKKDENVFQSLGMNDKDISWVSSMASPPPLVIPGSEFNTVEKATFLPEEKFQNIQPRALFSPTYDENFGCKPLSFSSESEDDEAYKTNIRLSDVCATLNQLEVKSFEQSQSEEVNKNNSQSNNKLISPVIKMKKLERSAKKQKPILVKSPQSAGDNYDFSIGESITPITPDEPNSTGSVQNFIEDDSFQSMSFSCLDELCKTLVNSTNSTKSIDCDQTITNQNESSGNLKPYVKKIFYKTKTKPEVQEVIGGTILCASARALEEGDVIPTQTNKLKKKFVEKGIVRLDELNGKMDAVKRLNSDQNEGKVEKVKKLKMEENDSSNWEEGKDFCLSQHSFSDCEMFRIVENLEKSLGNQDFDKSKTVFVGNEKMDCSSAGAEGINQQTSSCSSSKNLSIGFVTASGSKLVISEQALTKAKESFEKCMEETEKSCHLSSTIGFSNASGKKIEVSFDSLEKAKKLMLECDQDSNEETLQNHTKKLPNFKDIKTLSPDKKINLSNKIVNVDNVESPELNIKRNCKKDLKIRSSTPLKGTLTSTSNKFHFPKTESNSDFDSNLSFIRNTKPIKFPFGFSTAAGTKVNISEEAIEKAKALMLKDLTDDIKEEEINMLTAGFSTAAGAEVNESEVVRKTKDLTSKECTGENQTLSVFDFPSTSGCRKNASEKAVEKFRNEIKFRGNEASEENAPENKFSTIPMGFSTAAGTKVNISKEALEKAKALLADDDFYFTKTKTELEKETSKSSESRKNVFEKAVEKFRNEIKFTRNDIMGENASENNCSTVPMGFSTAAGTKVRVSKEALEKAKALMADEEFKYSKCKVESEQETITGSTLPEVVCNGFSTPAGTKVNISKEALEKTKLLITADEIQYTENCIIKKNSPENRVSTIPMGFSTAAGTKVSVSREALEKAKALMADNDFTFTNKKMELENETSKSYTSTQREVPCYGFSTAAGTKVSVSKEALEKAKALMPNEEEEEGLSKPLMDFVDSNFGFSTAVGTKVSVSKEALEKAEELFFKEDIKLQKNLKEDRIGFDGPKTNLEKNNSSGHLIPEKISELSTGTSEVPILGFSTALGNKINVSAEALKKAKSLMSEEEGTTKSFENNVDKKNIPEAKIAAKTKKGNFVPLSTNVEEEWDEIIPSWLHVYSTSPSIVSDRTDLIPMVIEEADKSTNCDKEYIVKSPVFGSHDRFAKKRKRKRLDFGCELKDSIDSETKIKKNSEKNTSSCMALDFSAPFKRMKSEEDEVGGVMLNVKEERAKARAEQEKIAKEKQKVRPVKGSHLLKKSKEKQMKWLEAVKGLLPKVYSNEYLKSMNVKEDVFNVNVTNAVDFKFNGVDFFGYCCLTNVTGFQVGDGATLIPDDDNKFGVEEFKHAFLASNGVQPNLLPVGWLENHYKWIVWKLSHYEKSFPQFFGGNCLTPHNVMLQLKYRYDREIDGSERSALRKILERDDTPLKRLVLCVCGIKKVVKEGLAEYILSLTDGWYSCPARADPALTRLVESGKVSIGTKLITQGAALINCEQGISPLEISEDVYLKISTNSLRRVRWDAKLGFQKNPENITVSLGSILPQGGNISCLNVIIVRVYPMLYMEKTADGCHVTRNLRLEEKAEAEHQRIQEKRMEAILNEINKEMENQKKKSESSESLSQLMENNSDPSGEMMTLTQKQNIVCNRNDRRAREIREKIEQKLKKEKLGKRNVSEFLRVRVVDLKRPDYNNPATLSIWNPGEEVVRILSEGKAVAITNISIGSTSRSYKPMQLNTTRSTHFKEINKCVKYPARKLTHLKDVSSKVCPAFEEVDLAGVVTKVQEIAYGSRLSQVVYLTDLNFNFVGILFWGSCKNYGWESVFKLYSTVSCSNLLWKKNYSVQEVPLLHVNESSVFTENPKHPYLKKEIERLKSKIPQDKGSFFAKLEEELTDKLEESKWKNNSSRSSLSNDSSLCKPRLSDELDSKPSASSTPIKPFSSVLTSNEPEPSPIQKRIEKLQSYGEPPPLLPLIVTNRGRKMKKS